MATTAETQKHIEALFPGTRGGVPGPLRWHHKAGGAGEMVLQQGWRPNHPNFPLSGALIWVDIPIDVEPPKAST